MKKFIHQKTLSLHDDLKVNNIIETNFTSKNRSVDINKLLNRVKVNKQNELKEKIIFFCSGMFVLVFTAILITFVK